VNQQEDKDNRSGNSAPGERGKELNCLHRIEEILTDTDAPLAETSVRLLQVIPAGWRNPEACQVRIAIEGERFDTPGFTETDWSKTEDIVSREKVSGTITVTCGSEPPTSSTGPFLREESRLLRTIALRLGHFLAHRRTRGMTRKLQKTLDGLPTTPQGEWRAVLEISRQTNRRFYLSLSRKKQLLRSLGMCSQESEAEELLKDWNVPGEVKRQAELSEDLNEVAFAIAAAHLEDAEILSLIKRWIQEGQLSFLARVVNRHLSLAEVAEALPLPR